MVFFCSEAEENDERGAGDFVKIAHMSYSHSKNGVMIRKENI